MTVFLTLFYKSYTLHSSAFVATSKRRIHVAVISIPFMLKIFYLWKNGEAIARSPLLRRPWYIYIFILHLA